MTEQSHTSFDDALKTLQLLNEVGYPSMFAGGCVRDRLLNVPPKDFDIATTATPQEVTAIFESHGYRVVPTGVEHGTITVMAKSGPVEITTLRRDISTDGRHAVVDFNGATFETDAARRDFTINAMFEDIQGKIHDFHHGLEDIRNGILRFVGAPNQRIQEDYLRILRFFRFWSRLGFKPDTAAIAAIKQGAKGLAKISQERITSELWGIVSAPHASDAITSMAETGVLQIVLPESVPLNHAHRVILMDAESMSALTRPWVQISIILGVIDQKTWTTATLNQLARRLRFSDRQNRLLTDIITGWQSLSSMPRQIAAALEFVANLEHHSPGFTILDFFAPIWTFFARHANDTVRQECVGWLVSTDIAFGERRRMQLPINGHDVVTAFPHAQGAEIGDVMSKLKYAFYNGEWRTRQEGQRYMEKLIEKPTAPK